MNIIFHFHDKDMQLFAVEAYKQINIRVSAARSSVTSSVTRKNFHCVLLLSSHKSKKKLQA